MENAANDTESSGSAAPGFRRQSQGEWLRCPLGAGLGGGNNEPHSAVQNTIDLISKCL